MAFRFFHGTHSGNLASILQNGLTPLPTPSSAMRGNLSTLPGFTEQRIFLAPCMREAAYYAQEQANFAGAAPIIFAVILPDDANLTVSDDYIFDKGIKAMLAAAGLPALELDEFGDVHEYGKSSDAYYTWREIFGAEIRALLSGQDFSALPAKESYLEMLSDLGHGDLAPTIWQAASRAMVDAMHHPWQHAIATCRDPSVGYAGIIPPACLTLLEQPAVASAIRQISRGDFSPAQWDIEVPDEAFTEIAPVPAPA